MYIEQLMNVLGISWRKVVFQSILDEMVKDGQVVQTKKKYALPESLDIIGRIQGNARGLASCTDDPKYEDIYIS